MKFNIGAYYILLLFCYAITVAESINWQNSKLVKSDTNQLSLDDKKIQQTRTRKPRSIDVYWITLDADPHYHHPPPPPPHWGHHHHHGHYHGHYHDHYHDHH